jgi:hypothetical protein
MTTSALRVVARKQAGGEFAMSGDGRARAGRKGYDDQ